jgi:hypothetical protein
MVAVGADAHDHSDVSADLSATLLILGATIVPWLLWMTARARRGPADDALAPERLATTLTSQAKHEESGDAVRTHAQLQLRPDGVVLDWRDESKGSTQTPPGSTATQLIARR